MSYVEMHDLPSCLPIRQKELSGLSDRTFRKSVISNVSYSRQTSVRCSSSAPNSQMTDNNYHLEGRTHRATDIWLISPNHMIHKKNNDNWSYHANKVWRTDWRTEWRVIQVRGGLLAKNFFFIRKCTLTINLQGHFKMSSLQADSWLRVLHIPTDSASTVWMRLIGF